MTNKDKYNLIVIIILFLLLCWVSLLYYTSDCSEKNNTVENMNLLSSKYDSDDGNDRNFVKKTTNRNWENKEWDNTNNCNMRKYYAPVHGKVEDVHTMDKLDNVLETGNYNLFNKPDNLSNISNAKISECQKCYCSANTCHKQNDNDKEIMPENNLLAAYDNNEYRYQTVS